MLPGETHTLQGPAWLPQGFRRGHVGDVKWGGGPQNHGTGEQTRRKRRGGADSGTRSGGGAPCCDSGPGPCASPGRSSFVPPSDLGISCQLSRAGAGPGIPTPPGAHSAAHHDCPRSPGAAADREPRGASGANPTRWKIHTERISDALEALPRAHC